MRTTSTSQVIKNIENNDMAIESLKGLQIANGRLLFSKDNRYEIKIADTNELKEQAYRLIYEIYLEKEFIQEDPSRMWFSRYDANPSTITLVVLQEKQVVGALTLVFDDFGDFPAFNTYHAELGVLKRSSRNLAELVSLGIDKKVRGASEILTKLFNISYLISKYLVNVDKYVVTVNPRHVSFYQEKLGFEELGGLRKCKKVGGAPSKLLILDLEKTKRLIRTSQEGLAEKRTLYDGFLLIKDGNRIMPQLKSMLLSSRRSHFFVDEIMAKRENVAEELYQIALVN